jgi:hypothetical protein
MRNDGLNADFQRSAPKNGEGLKRRDVLLGSSALLAASALAASGVANQVQAQAPSKPNILVIMADDIGSGT